MKLAEMCQTRAWYHAINTVETAFVAHNPIRPIDSGKQFNTGSGAASDQVPHCLFTGCTFKI